MSGGARGRPFATRNIQDYRRAVREHRDDTPAFFNFGVDVVDRLASEANGPALVWTDASGQERRFAFSDIARLTDRLASSLRRLGIAPGDRVIVMLPRIPEWQIAMVACLKLGAVPIPSIEMLTEKDLAYRVGHSGARAVVARAAQAAKFASFHDALAVRVAVGGPVPGWEDFDAALADGDADFVAARVAAEAPALLYYTSGSTGQPKGVLHASRAIHAWRGSAHGWLDLGPGDLIWCTADTGWSKAGTSILFGPWSVGACAFFHDGPFDPRRRLALLERHGVTVYCAPGTELFRLVDEDIAAYDLGRLRHVVSAGEVLSPVVAARWLAATGVPVAEAYGQTETLMTVVNLGCLPLREGSMGVAAPGCELAVIDEAGRRLPDSEEGDLALRAPDPQLMLGYLDEPERTARCYLDGPDGRWFVTGDRAIRDVDGYFFHRGRSDDVINSAGYRIGPSEVENVLLDHPAVREVAVVGSPDARRGEIVKAFVVLRDGVEATPSLAAELQAHVKRITAPYKYPRAIAFVAELPKTLTGKIQRSALRNEERRLAAAAGGGAGTAG